MRGHLNYRQLIVAVFVMLLFVLPHITQLLNPNASLLTLQTDVAQR
jgi:hypothetical protein